MPASQLLDDLQGQVERVTYTDERSGYTVAKVRIDGRRDPVTVVGAIPGAVPGAVLAMRGEWKNHPRFGEQFRIHSCRIVTPATIHGMEKYLGSGLVKGIGPVTAKRIVDRFQEKTLHVIENETEKLADVAGVGPKRIAGIRKAWAEQREIRQVMVFLQDHGVGSGYATKIYKKYGDETIPVIQENPYRLASDISGIGFVMADRIAEKMGFGKDSVERSRAGILYVLGQMADEGHVFYPLKQLVVVCAERLGIDAELARQAVRDLAAEGRHSRIVLDRNGSGLDDGDEAVYLTPFYMAETQLAARLQALIATGGILSPFDVDRALAWVQRRLSLELAERQIEAIRMACGRKVLVITGGPGTGKTTIIKAILHVFSTLKARVLLAAPTGRAAKRMAEATGAEARTIHRLLEYSRQKGGFQRNDVSPLEGQVLIVDEASMIDTLLMHHLLKALPRTAVLILVGDIHQLPSVGAGNVLRDIMSSGAVPVVHLDEIFRQSRGSAIVVNAHRIQVGKMPRLTATGDNLEDFYFIEQEDPEKVARMILLLVKERIPDRFGFDPFGDIQVLTPMNRGALGAERLNAILQDALNPAGDVVVRGGRTFRRGDKVMQITNNYDKEVFNGDMGRIVAVDPEEQEVRVRMDDREVAYDFADLDELVLAYAVSVHKSQGSEYPAVVLPLLMQHYLLLQRNLLYTGVTRGKRLVVVIGTRKALAVAVRNDRIARRWTCLAERLQQGMKGVG